ncbi:Phosphoribosylamine--glycine ligase [hydrothermal vent metagenome]|uniref:phosphoribosylamine--glycine ligase n=1 Tax=hydrothermal vent metagenome TaxID=652676 RepID=A0A3B0TTK1_9ZZZZ
MENKMNVLLIGSGGREHALAFKLSQSKKLSRLFIAPGNPGTAQLGENVPLDVAEHKKVISFCSGNKIDLVVIGPEAPLVAGLGDDLREAGFAVFGPNKEAAQLEGSKSFTKALCDQMNIPTAKYARFDELSPAIDYVRKKGAPIVVKADGLAAGKGVTVAMTLSEAEAAISECFSGRFAQAGSAVVIEQFLVGQEVSFFAVCDGKNFVTLATAQDHKRAHDGDKGPNTGGMGAYSPAPVMNAQLTKQVNEQIIAPTLEGMARRGTPFSGVLYAGLMLTKEGPKLIEYNVRFGDPECQVLMMRMETDLLQMLMAAATGDLLGIEAKWRDEAALCVVLAATGYPGPYQKGGEIGNVKKVESPEVKVFHAGTKISGGRLLANGGRVLNVTALGATIGEAQERAYKALDAIGWKGGFCRRDIGWRASKKQ